MAMLNNQYDLPLKMCVNSIALYLGNLVPIKWLELFLMELRIP
jgi:hypothetical protein